jgi:hypothetical protein
VQRGILADPISGTAVLEYGATEILPPVRAISKHPARLCRRGRQAGRAHPLGKPGFSTYESGCGRETDCPLEGDGFEPSVPREGNYAARLPPDRGCQVALDSPLEEGGFEPSVPRAKESVSLAEGNW